MFGVKKNCGNTFNSSTMDIPGSLYENNMTMLLAEQDKAIAVTNSKLDSIKEFQRDFSELERQLDEQSKTFRKPKVISFGKRALVRAHLEHTNEVLVYLGGDGQYFAEMSAHEAVNLMKRREKKLGIQEEALKKQLKLLEDRRNYTSTMVGSNAPKVRTKDNITEDMTDEKTVEIVEYLTVEEEKQWIQQHKQHLSKSSNNNHSPAPVDSSSEDEDAPNAVLSFAHTKGAKASALKINICADTVTPGQVVNLFERNKCVELQPSAKELSCVADVVEVGKEKPIVVDAPKKKMSKFKKSRKGIVDDDER